MPFYREIAATCFPLPIDSLAARCALNYWEAHPTLELLVSPDRLWSYFTESSGRNFESLSWRVLTVLRRGSFFDRMNSAYCPCRWVPREVGGLFLCSPESGWKGRTALRFAGGDEGNVEFLAPGEAVGEQKPANLTAFSTPEAALAWIEDHHDE